MAKYSGPIFVSAPGTSVLVDTAWLNALQRVATASMNLEVCLSSLDPGVIPSDCLPGEFLAFREAVVALKTIEGWPDAG